MVEQQRYNFIDALRGVAVLMVIMAHTPVPQESAVLKLMSTSAAYGVQLFFIVSAFTLFLSLHTKRAWEARPVLFFFIRRIFRIVPAFYFAVAFYLLQDGVGPRAFAPEGIHTWQIISTLLFTNGWHPEAINAVVPGGWSIAVEMTFYLFVPICFIFITSTFRSIVLALILAFVGLALNTTVLPYMLASYSDQPTLLYWFPRLWFPAQACVFPIGFALYFLIKADRTIVGSFGAAALLLISTFLFILFVRWNFLLPTQFLVALAIGLGCFALSQHSLTVIVNPVMCHIGKVSFSVYLLHFWIIGLTHTWLQPLWVGVAPSLAAMLFYACVVLGSVAAATITYEVIERPGQLLGRRWIASLQKRAVASMISGSPEGSCRDPK